MQLKEKTVRKAKSLLIWQTRPKWQCIKLTVKSRFKSTTSLGLCRQRAMRVSKILVDRLHQWLRLTLNCTDIATAKMSPKRTRIADQVIQPRWLTTMSRLFMKIRRKSLWMYSTTTNKRSWFKKLHKETKRGCKTTPSKRTPSVLQKAFLPRAMTVNIMKAALTPNCQSLWLWSMPSRGPMTRNFSLTRVIWKKSWV